MSPKNPQHILATGRRKTSVAQIRLVPNGEGKVMVNAKPVEAYFHGLDHQVQSVLAPIEAVESAKKFDYVLKVGGGGITGQAGAVRHAIARALAKLDEKSRKLMRVQGYLTRDPRMVERKKSGQPKARKRFQYSKR
ncbi:MAG: 30S ribosomal protein S9 [Elusimicrobia bacterium]|nr:30S ribosomal protein S9 [Elusimicrobiota bacterium]